MTYIHTSENISCASCKVATLRQLKVLNNSNLAGLKDDSGGNTLKNLLYFVLSERAGLALEYDSCTNTQGCFILRYNIHV